MRWDVVMIAIVYTIRTKKQSDPCSFNLYRIVDILSAVA